MAPYWEQRRCGGYFEELTQFSLFAKAGGEVIGYAGYQMREFAGARTLVIDASGLLPAFQGLGLMGPMFVKNFFREHRLSPHRAMYMVTRTENPVVYVGLRKLLGRSNIFPLPTGRPVPEHIQQIGIAAAAFLGQRQQFIPEQLKVVGAYPELGKMYAAVPRSSDRVVNDIFDQTLTELDAFLLVGKATLARLTFWRPWYPLFVHARGPWKAKSS